MRMLVSDDQVRGALAMWACRQSPYGVPEDLAKVIQVVGAKLKALFTDEVFGDFRGKWFDDRMELRKWLTEQFIKDVEQWNVPRSGHNSQFNFVSRYDSPRPDDDFIDLDALFRNVAWTIDEEDQKNRKFDADFEARNAEPPA